MEDQSQTKKSNPNPNPNHHKNTTEGTKKKKKMEKNDQFEFCRVCKLNHDQGRRHNYFPNHTKSLSSFLSRFQSKLSDVRFFLKNPSLLRPEHASPNRLWCVVCDSDIDESRSSFVCANAINHLASVDHLKNLKGFLWKYGGGMDRVDSLRITESDLVKWEKKCKSLKSEVASEESRGFIIGPLNDIHNEMKSEYIDSFDKNNIHSLNPSFSNGVAPLQNYTNERYQVSSSEIVPLLQGANSYLCAGTPFNTSSWATNDVTGCMDSQHFIISEGRECSADGYLSNGVVVTDSASAYVKAGEELMKKRKHLFWSPCAAHCIDNMLKDIGELNLHKETMSKARTITVYIYNHTWVLNLMREYIGGNLTRAGVTRFATEYLTLKSLAESKIELNAMFSSEEWQRSSFAKKKDGMRVRDIIVADAEFWPSVKYCLNCVVPLVKVLRLVDGDVKPAMGYIYEAMDKAKEQIAKNFNGVKKRYKVIWDIIDSRWDLQLHRPLHAAAYYLNPRFQYAPEFDADYEIMKGLYETIERMCPSPALREKVDKQRDLFRNAELMFGREMAIQMRDKKHPALWWESYGSCCKELQKLAIRILSLTCSATGCERNWSTFDQVHSKRRNRLEQQRLDALVFVKYNLRLEERHKKRVEKGDSYDPISLSDMESDDEWITEKEDPVLPLDLAWIDSNKVDCFQVEGEGECSKKKRKRGPRDLSYNKNLKGKQVIDEEEQDEDDEVQEVEEIVELDGDGESEDLLADEDIETITPDWED